MLSLDSFPPEIIERIIDNLPHAGQVALSKVSRRFSSLIPTCEMETLKLLLHDGKLHISSSPIDRPTAQQFSAINDHFTTTMKRMEMGQVKCFRTLSYPPSSNYSLFAEARIGHLEISQPFPISLDKDNVNHLSALLAGCTVEKITLVLNNNTMTNLDHVPEFLSSIHAKHVEFVRQRVAVFSEESSLPLDVLLNIFNAGIDSITVNLNIIDCGDLSAFDAFIDKLSQIGTSKRLLLYVRNSELLDLSLGTNKKSDRVTINVTEKNGRSEHISIEYTAENFV